VKIRAAVLEEFGEPLVVQELELTEPSEGEVLVRLVACHGDVAEVLSAVFGRADAGRDGRARA